MSETTKPTTSRREFLKNTGRVAAATALASAAGPPVHAAESNTIQVALIGCGGRGTGAAGDALSVKKENGPTKLVAMGDVFEDRVRLRYASLKKQFGDKVDVPEDRRFVGFDAYKKAMDCLRPGDVAIFGTPPAFRWVHFTYAIKKGIHVFMEKPVTVDGPTTRRMIKLAAEADKKNLKVGVGLMIRHCRGRQELKRRIEDGQIGEIIAMRAYRMGGRAATVGPPPEGTSELLHQVRRFHSFIWASGGMYNDYFIHQIDECSWMKGAWPVQAHALGGRHYRGPDAIDQNLDTYSVEYAYPDGTRLYYYGRNMSGCKGGFASYAHGTKGTGVISASGHYPGRVKIYRGYNVDRDVSAKPTSKLEDPLWAFPQPEQSPYQLEWDDLIEAIRQDKPYNEAKRGAEASLVSSMGRMSAHTGQIITFEEMLNHEHELAPDVDKLTMDSPAPVQLKDDGTYPVPMPGILKNREY